MLRGLGNRQGVKRGEKTRCMRSHVAAASAAGRQQKPVRCLIPYSWAGRIRLRSQAAQLSTRCGRLRLPEYRRYGAQDVRRAGRP